MAEERKKDRHQKKPFQLRLDERLRRQLEKLVERQATDLTAEISNAIRERLERFDLWPPAARKPHASDT